MEYITSAERIGREHGLKEGLEKGKQEGQYELLKMLLEQKFGLTIEKYLQQLNDADVGTLRQWSKRLFTAKTLEEVF